MLRSRNSLVLILLALAGSVSSSSRAATYFVNTVSDAVVDDSECGLREAVASANIGLDLLGCVGIAGADPDIILITATGTIETIGMTVLDPVTILGPGADLLSISGRGTNRIIEVDGNGVDGFRLEAVTLRDGLASDGGAALIVYGQLDGLAANVILDSVRVTSNVVLESSPPSLGGAVVVDYAQSLVIFDSEFVANEGSRTIGGALRVSTVGGGTATIEGSLFSHNSAAEGGALLYNSIGGGDKLTIENTTIAWNSSDFASGSAVHVTIGPGEVEIRSSTIAWNEGAGLQTGHSADPSVLLHQIVVAHNEVADCDFPDAVVSSGFSLDTDGTCGFTAASDLGTVADPGLSSFGCPSSKLVRVQNQEPMAPTVA